jgi:hypothetical protein
MVCKMFIKLYTKTSPNELSDFTERREIKSSKKARVVQNLFLYTLISKQAAESINLCVVMQNALIKGNYLFIIPKTLEHVASN